jgi:hypothetical protein
MRPRLQWRKSASPLVFRHQLNVLTASSVLVAGLEPGSMARLFCDIFNSLIRERLLRGGDLRQSSCLG